MKVAIFFFRPWFGAGSTTFTAHLHKGLKVAGHEPMVYRVADSAQPWDHKFGDYEGVAYRVVTYPEAKRIVAGQPSLMSAVERPPHIRDGIIDTLMRLGMRAVIHDDGEAQTHDWSAARRPICVRQAVTALVPGSVWLPHPYVRQRVAAAAAGVKSGAVSLARVSPAKRPEIILQANRLLPAESRIAFLGMEARLYSKKLRADYGDVFTRQPRGGIAFPLTFEAPVTAAAGAELHVDMSYFKRDGGGTQYAELEAMDAGCVNVMRVDWFRFPGDLQAGVHAISVADAAELAKTVAAGEPPNAAAIRAAAEQLLTAHDAKTVAQAYIEELTTQ